MGTPQARRRVSQVAPQLVVAIAAAALAATVWRGLPLIADTVDSARERRGEPAETLRLAPAYSVGLDPAVLLGAARVLPRDARYAVVVGDTLPLPGVLGDAVEPLLHHWLLPRRHTRIEEADWVIAYGHPTETLGVTIRREVAIVPGVSVAEIAR